jgi:hypothetical protein
MLAALVAALVLAVLGTSSASSSASVSHVAGTIWTMSSISGNAQLGVVGLRPAKNDIRVTPYGTIWT